jgi:dihydroorotate dehydrogenase electron transfer subunit
MLTLSSWGVPLDNTPLYTFSEAEIILNKKLAEKTYLIRFSISDNALYAFNPGKFLMIRLSETYDPLLNRPFSISNADERNGWFEILYRIVGKGTEILSRKKIGERFRFLGPLGHGFPTVKNAVLIGGGIGIAPLLSLFSVKKLKIQAVFWGIKKKVEYFDFKKICLNFYDIPTHLASEDGSVGTQGMVPDVVEALLNSSINVHPTVFACGPVKMLKAIHRICFRKNLPLFVSMESCMACGMGYCLGCAIPRAGVNSYLKVCQDGPIFDSSLIDWGKIYENG